MSNVFCIWYPSGGFGHFINAVISLYGQGFVKPNSKFALSGSGNSHEVELVANKYMHDPDSYSFEFDSNQQYSVLVDNGITNEGTKFKQYFPTANIIKICYDDVTWPIVARTTIDKAMSSTVESEIAVDFHLWPTNEPWAKREKFYLYLRDHPLRQAWRPAPDCLILQIDQMLSYNKLVSALSSHEIVVEDFEQDWNRWRLANDVYIQPIELSLKVIKSIVEHQHMDLESIKDLWTQAVVNYFIWLHYNFEVPANDYSDWFTNTEQIAKMLDSNGIKL